MREVEIMESSQKEGPRWTHPRMDQKGYQKYLYMKSSSQH